MKDTDDSFWWQRRNTLPNLASRASEGIVALLRYWIWSVPRSSPREGKMYLNTHYNPYPQVYPHHSIIYSIINPPPDFHTSNIKVSNFHNTKKSIKMVAITSLIPIIALTALVSAIPEPGQSVATYRFFNRANCDFSGGDQRETLTAIMPGGSTPLQQNQRLVGTCYSENAYASLAVFNIEAGCQSK